MNTKICTVCKIEKTVDEYNKAGKKENASNGAKIIPKEVFQHKVTVLAFLFHERT